jgi:metallo-beta-lactamase class B
MLFVSSWLAGPWAALAFCLAGFPAKTSLSLPPPPTRLRMQPVADRVFMPVGQPATAGSMPNGLLIQTRKGLLLVDAAWSAPQTEQLLRWAADSLHQRVRVLFLTHARAATPEALAVLQRHHVRLYSTPLTARRWHSAHPKAPALVPALKPYTLVRAGHTRLELFFPGARATADKGVAWLPRQKVLFGGQLTQAPPPGTTASRRAAWAVSVRMVVARYPRARVVVPARGPVGTLALLAPAHRSQAAIGALP